MKCGLVLLLSCYILLAWGQAENGFLRGPGGGFFHPSCHVVLPEGGKMLDNERIQLADGTFQTIPPCSHSHNNSARTQAQVRGEKREADGWNTYSRYFMNAYIDAFNGDWVVPNNPVAGYRGQTLFFFTGLEDPACNCILQPVVWFGLSAAGGSTSVWSAAVWYVYNNNANFVTSPVVQVNPGEYIATYMIRTPGTGWASGMQRNGVQITGGTFPDVLQSNAYCTLEVYGVVDCNSLPVYQGTVFQNLAITQDGVGAVGFSNANWAIFVSQTDCSQSMSCNGNECTMFYGAWALCPANAGEALGNGQTLSTNAVNAIVSTGCGYRLILQGDGNLVVYDPHNTPLWYTSTTGVGVAPFLLVMQGDGNLVLYDANSTPTWYSGTSNVGVAPYTLVMQTDSNLVIYDGNGTPIWYTNH